MISPEPWDNVFANWNTLMKQKNQDIPAFIFPIKENKFCTYVGIQDVIRP